MTLVAFITDAHNALFAGALALMLLIALLEGVTTLLGMGLSNMIEGFFPDINLDIEAPQAPSALSRLLGWLHVGRIPVLILLVLFLTAFGLIGYGIQSLLVAIFGVFFPGWMVAIVAIFVALPIVKTSGAVLEKMIPQDESSAISEEDYIGRIAFITLGNARKGYPAEAKLSDQYGQTHYLMVEPESDGIVFNQGEEVLLVARANSKFIAIKNNHTALSDTKENV